MESVVPNVPSNRARLGFAFGLGLGLTDLVVLWGMGVEMHRGDANMWWPVMGVFTLTFGALGYAIGRLADARAKERADARTIEEQLAELRRAQKQMLHYERLASIGRMAAGVAHEVRNPLGVIKSSASLLCDVVDPREEDAVKAGRFIGAEIDRLDRFIEALLDFSRPLAPARRATTAADLAVRIDELVGESLRRATVHLEIEEKGGPWQLDADMIARSIVATVVNASQAVGTGGKIRVRLDGVEGALTATVVDDGPGVTADMAERLFEPFVTNKAKGTGLGLPMALRLVEAHGGRIDHVVGEGLGAGGRGACFRITVPPEAEAVATRAEHAA